VPDHRILHLADTHLGYSAYQRLVPEGEPWSGLNQREADIYTAWHGVVEAALKEKPDVVVHSGDLFDSVRPSNRALHEAISGLGKLTRAGIPVVLIAGNHETPRLRETGHVFRLLESFESPLLFPIYKGPAEAIVVPGLEDLRIVGVPHSHTGMTDRIAKAVPDEEYKNNILLLHGVVTGLELPSKELNQAEIGSGLLKPTWDYIALGHYHGFTRVEDNTHYCGSTERFSFAEAQETKGYVMVQLPDLKVSHHELPGRDFVDLPWLDCSELQRLGRGSTEVGNDSSKEPSRSPGQLTFDSWVAPSPEAASEDGKPRSTEATVEDQDPGAPTGDRATHIDLNGLLQQALRQCRPDGKVIRQKVLNCPPELYRLVDFVALRKLTASAVHYQPRFELEAVGEQVQAGSTAIGKLDEEFLDFMAHQPLEGLGRERLEELGREYLMDAGGGS